MKRMILTGLLAIAAGATCLLAQAPAKGAGPKGPAPKSKGEMEALQALQAANGDPDKTIAACENLITKFVDTDFKSVALSMEAEAYQRKKDYDHMVIFAEKALEADPNDFRSMLMLANYYATQTREHDLDREEKLGKGEKIAHQVIDMMKTAPKPQPQVTDEQWADARKDITAEAYNDIGLGNLVRKNFDAAAAAFKTAADTNSRPEPAYLVREASALQQGGKNDEAIALCDKVIAIPDVFPQVKNVATSIRNAAIKAGGKAPGGEAK